MCSLEEVTEGYWAQLKAKWQKEMGHPQRRSQNIRFIRNIGLFIGSFVLIKKIPYGSFEETL